MVHVEIPYGSSFDRYPTALSELLRSLPLCSYFRPKQRGTAKRGMTVMFIVTVSGLSLPLAVRKNIFALPLAAREPKPVICISLSLSLSLLYTYIYI